MAISLVNERAPKVLITGVQSRREWDLPGIHPNRVRRMFRSTSPSQAFFLMNTDKGGRKIATIKSPMSAGVHLGMMAVDKTRIHKQNDETRVWVSVVELYNVEISGE